MYVSFKAYALVQIAITNNILKLWLTKKSNHSPEKYD